VVGLVGPVRKLLLSLVTVNNLTVQRVQLSAQSVVFLSIADYHD